MTRAPRRRGHSGVEGTRLARASPGTGLAVRSTDARTRRQDEGRAPRGERRAGRPGSDECQRECRHCQYRDQRELGRAWLRRGRAGAAGVQSRSSATGLVSAERRRGGRADRISRARSAPAPGCSRDGRIAASTYVAEPSLDLTRSRRTRFRPAAGELPPRCSLPTMRIGEPVDRIPALTARPPCAAWPRRPTASAASRCDRPRGMGEPRRRPQLPPGVGRARSGQRRRGRARRSRLPRATVASACSRRRPHALARLDASEVLAIAAARPARSIGRRRARVDGRARLHDDQAPARAASVVSDDDGETWRSLIAPHHGDASESDLGEPRRGHRLRTGHDGSVGSDAATTVRAGAWRHRHTARAPRTTRSRWCSPATLRPLRDGPRRPRWVWPGTAIMQLAADHATAPAGLIAGPDRTVGGVVPVRNWDVRVAAGRHRTLAVADGRLLDLGRGAPRVVTRQVPGRVDALAVDGIGRAVATVGGSALRYSPRHGWRRLFEIPPR